jgi:hypothetical protein
VFWAELQQLPEPAEISSSASLEVRPVTRTPRDCRKREENPLTDSPSPLPASRHSLLRNLSTSVSVTLLRRFLISTRPRIIVAGHLNQVIATGPVECGSIDDLTGIQGAPSSHQCGWLSSTSPLSTTSPPLAISSASSGAPSTRSTSPHHHLQQRSSIEWNLTRSSENLPLLAIVPGGIQRPSDHGGIILSGSSIRGRGPYQRSDQDWHCDSSLLDRV